MRKLMAIAALSVLMAICGHCGWYLHGYFENKKAEDAKNAMTAVSKNLAKNPLAMFMWQWQNTAVSTKTNAEAKPERVKLTPEQALEQEETKLKKMVNKMERYFVRMVKDGKVTADEMRNLAKAYDKFEASRKEADQWLSLFYNGARTQIVVPGQICEILSIYFRGMKACEGQADNVNLIYGDKDDLLKRFFTNLVPIGQDVTIEKSSMRLQILLSIVGAVIAILGFLFYKISRST